MAQNDDPIIRVTLEDTDKVVLQPMAPPPAAPMTGDGTAKSYGNINAAEPADPVIQEEKGSILLKGWFYLGAAGLIGATIAWGVCEPFFVDSNTGDRWGNIVMVPAIIFLMSFGFAVAESIVERSWQKALERCLLAIPLGLVFGFIFQIMAGILFNILLAVVSGIGGLTYRNPMFWVARGIAWVVFGVAGGLVYGIAGRSSKKGRYGVIGGILGAGLGGVLFDPISLVMHDSAILSRCIGFGLFGLSTGVAMGFVESALKDRWLYVSGGPLAGKQFILYKSLTIIGSQQSCDIYLFKDTSIAAQQATIELRGGHAFLRSVTPVFVAGVPTQARALQSGDMLQIGRYTFRYHERHKS